MKNVMKYHKFTIFGALCVTAFSAPELNKINFKHWGHIYQSNRDNSH